MTRVESNTMALALFLIGIFLLALSISYLLGGFDVVRRFPSGECVEVRPVGSCDEIPERHNIVWVSEEY